MTTADNYKVRIVNANGLPIQVDGVSTALYAGTITLSTSASAIGASQAVSEVIVQSDPDNTVDMLVGDATAQTIQLKPGDTLTISITNVALVFAKAISGTPVLNYLGRA